MQTEIVAAEEGRSKVAAGLVVRENSRKEKEEPEDLREALPETLLSPGTTKMKGVRRSRGGNDHRFVFCIALYSSPQKLKKRHCESWFFESFSLHPCSDREKKKAVQHGKKYSDGRCKISQ